MGKVPKLCFCVFIKILLVDVYVLDYSMKKHTSEGNLVLNLHPKMLVSYVHSVLGLTFPVTFDTVSTKHISHITPLLSLIFSFEGKLMLFLKCSSLATVMNNCEIPVFISSAVC